jgi:hypothetical protein
MTIMRRFFFFVLTLVILSVFIFNEKVVAAGEYQYEHINFTIRDIGDDPDLWNLFGDDWYVIARINRMAPGALSGRIKVPTDMEKARRYAPFPLQISEKGKIIFIDLAKQALAFYEGGILSEWMPISSGARGDETPKGRFYIAEKYPQYYSKTYPEPKGGASMPFALRLNNPYGGYFIHGGALSGKPASKGCVRLMETDAEDLYGWVRKGTKVLIK